MCLNKDWVNSDDLNYNKKKKKNKQNDKTKQRTVDAKLQCTSSK